MRWYFWLVFSLIVISVLILAFFNFNSFLDNKGVNFFTFNFGEITEKSSDDNLVSINKNKLFVTGDIMLARHVEYLMQQNNSDYPYKYLDFLKDENSLVLGNFEASVPKVHKKTPNFTFHFSVDKKYLTSLKKAGFSHLSLANNHSFDSGSTGFADTKKNLQEANFFAFGHPATLDKNSVSFITLNNKKIALVAVHTLYIKPKDEQISETFSFAKENSDFIITYIHWGVEYSKKSSAEQRLLAKKLIDAGSNLIIGHHPHVIQEVSVIENTPVFYSLGNLIFDQYFNNEVQEGLILELSFTDKVEIKLLPTSSKNSQAQPRLMSTEKRNAFLKELAKISDTNLASKIEEGELTLDF